MPKNKKPIKRRARRDPHHRSLEAAQKRLAKAYSEKDRAEAKLAALNVEIPHLMQIIRVHGGDSGWLSKRTEMSLEEAHKRFPLDPIPVREAPLTLIQREQPDPQPGSVIAQVPADLQKYIPASFGAPRDLRGVSSIPAGAKGPAAPPPSDGPPPELILAEPDEDDDLPEVG